MQWKQLLEEKKKRLKIENIEFRRFEEDTRNIAKNVEGRK